MPDRHGASTREEVSPRNAESHPDRQLPPAQEPEAAADAPNGALARLSGASPRRTPAPSRDILTLQRVLGNRAVQRMIVNRTQAQREQLDVDRQLEQQRGAGSPLPAPARERLEGFFGSDLSDVRVHTDQRADALASSLGATAFTTGRDMFFSSGTFAPETDTGFRLVAHETAHTVQQAAGPVSGVPVADNLAVSEPDDSFEQAADSAAAALATGSPPPAASPSGPPTSATNAA